MGYKLGLLTLLVGGAVFYGASQGYHPVAYHEEQVAARILELGQSGDPKAAFMYTSMCFDRDYACRTGAFGIEISVREHIDNAQHAIDGWRSPEDDCNIYEHLSAARRRLSVILDSKQGNSLSETHMGWMQGIQDQLGPAVSSFETYVEGEGYICTGSPDWTIVRESVANARAALTETSYQIYMQMEWTQEVLELKLAYEEQEIITREARENGVDDGTIPLIGIAALTAGVAAFGFTYKKR